MLRVGALSVAALSLGAVANANDCFRASFDLAKTGVSGYFDLDIGTNSAVYSWSFDVSDLVSACSPEEGLYMHVHSDWDGFAPDVTSSSTSCGGAGGHYDPTLACASASSMTYECDLLNRTVNAGYSYACNPTGFAAGLQYQCEVGDIAGKLGALVPDSGTDYHVYSGSLLDPFPPSAINFGDSSASDGIATAWQSLVLHCPSTGARLLCAQFTRSTCSDSSSDSSSDQIELSTEEFAGIIIGASLGMALLVVFVFIFVLGCSNKHGASSGEGQKILTLQQRS